MRSAAWMPSSGPSMRMSINTRSASGAFSRASAAVPTAPTTWWPRASRRAEMSCAISPSSSTTSTLQVLFSTLSLRKRNLEYRRAAAGHLEGALQLPRQNLNNLHAQGVGTHQIDTRGNAGAVVTHSHLDAALLAAAFDGHRAGPSVREGVL